MGGRLRHLPLLDIGTGYEGSAEPNMADVDDLLSAYLQPDAASSESVPIPVKEMVEAASSVTIPVEAGNGMVNDAAWYESAPAPVVASEEGTVNLQVQGNKKREAEWMEEGPRGSAGRGDGLRR